MRGREGGEERGRGKGGVIAVVLLVCIIHLDGWVGGQGCCLSLSLSLSLFFGDIEREMEGQDKDKDKGGRILTYK